MCMIVTITWYLCTQIRMYLYIKRSFVKIFNTKKNNRILGFSTFVLAKLCLNWRYYNKFINIITLINYQKILIMIY